MTNGKGAVGVIAALAVIVGLTVLNTTNIYSLTATVTHVEEQLGRLPEDMSTALRVLGDHGNEIQYLRDRIMLLQTENAIDRLATVIGTAERFTGQDWKEEKARLENRLKQLESNARSRIEHGGG